MPNETKKDFCCLIVSGFGTGNQSGVILRDHMCDNGMDTFLTTPSGREPLRMEREHWIHGVRMEYLALRKEYQRVALIGLSLGGVLLLHMQDLEPAASVFVNTPCAADKRARTWNRVFQADLQEQMGGMRAVAGKYQLRRLAERTRKQGAGCVQCPTLILQTMDDKICTPEHADQLFKLLRVQDKALRYYPEGGHDVLSSRTVLAVCSDIFQFCSRVRGRDISDIKMGV